MTLPSGIRADDIHAARAWLDAMSATAAPAYAARIATAEKPGLLSPMQDGHDYAARAGGAMSGTPRFDASTLGKQFEAVKRLVLRLAEMERGSP
jgi:hypothetical protein